MFTVLWKIDQDHEELFSTHSICRLPAASANDRPADHLPCSGRAHVSFDAVIPHSDYPRGANMVIDCGDVFVMNSEGKTVATYRFDSVAKLKAA